MVNYKKLHIPARSVVLIDPQVAVRQMLSHHLLQDGHYNVIGEAASESEAQEIFLHIIPEIVILELSLPETAGLNILRFLRSSHKSVRIVLFTALENPVMLAMALQEDPQGYVSKMDTFDELRLAVQTVARGGVYWTPYAEEILNQTGENGSLGEQTLSEKEIVLLSMVAHGWSSKEIASKLEISPKTVDNQRLHLMRKLSIRNASGLTRFAIANGILSQSR